ncbi:MAG: sugar ABC transporter substrate-binding protein [Proteobacteria bacterium]|nr:sugar ABC transporter substrate-binding protein [Pseudomonadota bacterium]
MKGPSDTLIEMFMEMNPDIEVEPIYLNERFHPTYAIKLAADEAPDLVWMGMGFLGFAGEGAFLDISDRIKADKDFDSSGIFPVLLDFYKYAGALYGIPTGVTTNVIAYNKDLFDKAGMAYPTDDWTMEEMVDMARKLTKDFDGDGVNDQWGIADWDSTGQTSLLYGGPMFNEDGTKILIDRPIARDMLVTFYNMVFNYKCHPQPSEAQTLFGSGSLRAFRSGKVAISGIAAWGRGLARTIEDFDWDVVMYPSYKGQRGVYMSGEAYLISAATKSPDEAYRFLKFTTTEEWARLMKGSYVPALKKLAYSDFFLESDQKPKNAEAYLKMLEFGSMPFGHPARTELTRAYGAASDRLLLPEGDKDKITSIDEFMNLAVKDMQKALDDFNAEH